MTYRISDFQSQLTITTRQHLNANKSETTAAAELNAIAALLATDPTVNDVTLYAPAAGITPGAAANSRYTNDVLLLVNTAKSSNPPAAIGTAITSLISSYLPPVNTTAPIVSGSPTVGQALSCTTGVWSYTPSSYAYQWLRGGANIAGAVAATYTTIAADSGTNVSCRVTASNAAGPGAPVVSNALTIG
jgi:hypothetical protein